ncbi:MAG TPA: family 10 glycosylhydrolase, partial [Niabella sp.]
MKRIRLVFVYFLLFSFYYQSADAQSPEYEFRGVWIATVLGIDWPPKHATVQQQKDEFIRQLDMHKRNGMNAVIVQVRPSGDAFYPSPYEPWSEWLTGVQGKAPAPFYDPLAFMIQEAHKRGMEFHAWLNPYRAEFRIGSSSIAPDNLIRKRPDWFITYGTSRYFDPSNKQVQQFVIDVVKDLVRRYDIDGIHMDDYFYPYP